MNCYDNLRSSSFWVLGYGFSIAERFAAPRTIRNCSMIAISGAALLFGSRILPTRQRRFWNSTGSRIEPLTQRGPDPRVGIAVMELISWLRRQLPGVSKNDKPIELTSQMAKRQFEIRQAQVLARLERIRIEAGVRDHRAEERHEEAEEWHQRAEERHRQKEGPE